MSRKKNNRISWNDYLNHQFFKKNYVDYNKIDNSKNNDMNLTIKYLGIFMEICEHIEKDYKKVIKEKTNKRDKIIEEQNSYYDEKVREIKEMSKEIIKIKNKYS